jgi:hypothetical protein
MVRLGRLFGRGRTLKLRGLRAAAAAAELIPGRARGLSVAEFSGADEMLGQAAH